MKTTTNAIQRNYMLSKALVETLKAQAHDIEQKYMIDHCVFADENGNPPAEIWMLDDDKIFDEINSATGPVIDALGLPAAQSALRVAEDALINYGLSIVPKSIADKLRKPCFGLNGDYVHIDTRAKVLDATLKLDVTAAPTLRRAAQ
jgi:hypothetical protein